MTIRILYPIFKTAPVSQMFGENPDLYPLTKGHNGIDFAIPNGTPIYAAHDGSIIRADLDQTGYGNHVRILHAEGWGTLYGHMQSFAVGQGRPVKAGDLLGESDNTGRSTGPHLHFELRTSMLNGQTAIDPMPYLTNSGLVIASGVCLVNGLRVRKEPNLLGEVRRYLPAGANLDFIAFQGDWGQLLDAGASWVCMKMSGENYVNLSTPAPETSTPDLTPNEHDQLAKLWAAHPELH
jgi:hypothetical protein